MSKTNSFVESQKQTNTMNLLSGLFDAFAGASMITAGARASASAIRTGGDIAAQGSLLTAAGLRQNKQVVQDSLIFNLKMDAKNSIRQLSALNTQFQRTISKQLATGAASGVSVGSKSHLLIRGEAHQMAERQILQTKIDVEDSRRAKIFESKVQQTNLENQARAADYQAAAERVMASHKAAEAEFAGKASAYRSLSGVFKQAPTILQGIFN